MCWLLAEGSEEVQFKIKKKTKLAKVMDAYCQKQGVQRQSLRFLFHRARIPEVCLALHVLLYCVPSSHTRYIDHEIKQDATAQSMEIEDGDM